MPPPTPADLARVVALSDGITSECLGKPVSRPSIDLYGISALALIVIGSFAIDRIVRGLLFCLSYWRRWSTLVPDPKDPSTPPSERKHFQLAYFVFAALLGIVALGWYGGVRILSALGFVGVDPILDTLVTGLILVGGADRIEGLVSKIGGASGESVPAAVSAPPIEITGTLVLDERSREHVEARHDGASSPRA